MPESLASTRIAARTGPTHGAAQSAKAAPRSALDPLCRAPSHEPGRGQALEERKRQEAHEREPEGDDHEPRHLEEQAPVLVEQVSGERRAGSERDEDEREAGDEGDARGDDAAAARAGRRAGDGREVAGDERQDAGGDEGEEPRREREGELGGHAS